MDVPGVATAVITTIDAVKQILHEINPPVSGIIGIENRTGKTLLRAQEHLDHGGFATDRAVEIPPGATDNFGVRSSSNSIATGVEGRVTYDVGGEGHTFLVVHWNGPFIGENTSDCAVSGTGAGTFHALADTPTNGSTDIHFRFHLSGGAAPTPTPTPGEHPGGQHPSNQNQPGNEHPGGQHPGGEHPGGEHPGGEHPGGQHPGGEHPGGQHPGGDHPGGQHPGGQHPGGEHPHGEHPAEHPHEPTLRHGDHDVHGWVAYLQQLLNERGAGPIGVDGAFGDRTYYAVTHFQQHRGLMVDGTVGNQTWAALRDETPVPPSTDGLAAHTFHEQHLEARWHAADDSIYFDSSSDTLRIQAVNTGSDPIAPQQFFASFTISGEAGPQLTHYLESATATGHPAQSGEYFFFQYTGIHGQVQHGTHRIEAQLPAELGGDQTHGEITVH